METTGLEFSDVYSEFHEKVHRYIQGIVGRDDAEDLTQEVFLKINQGLLGFKGHSSLSTWVYRIATNAALDGGRSRSYRESKGTAKLEEKGTEPDIACCVAEGKGLSAEREAIRNEMNACIQEFISKLPADYRAIIHLSEIKELKNQQIADVLGISLDAAKIRLHRASGRLKAELEAECDFYHDEEGTLACDRKNKPEMGE